MSEHVERARNMNAGFQLVRTALATLQRIDQSLLALVRQANDRGDNALAEGALPGQVTVGPAGITSTGWSGPHLLEANPKRRGLQVTNTHATAVITLGLGMNAPSAGAGIVLAPGQSWNGMLSAMVWRGSIAAVSSVAGGTLSFIEA